MAGSPPGWTQAQTFFMRLVEASGLLGWMCTEDGFCNYLSPGWHSYTGTTDGEGINWINALHPDDRVETRKTFYNAIDSRTEYRASFRLQRADGKYVAAVDHGVPQYGEDQRYLGFLGVVNTAEHATETGKLTVTTTPSADRAILTPREKEVLRLFAEGYTAETAALRLGISPFTVGTHANKAAVKLGALNRTHAVIKAMRLRELELQDDDN